MLWNVLGCFLSSVRYFFLIDRQLIFKAVKKFSIEMEELGEEVRRVRHSVNFFPSVPYGAVVCCNFLR